MEFFLFMTGSASLLILSALLLRPKKTSCRTFSIAPAFTHGLEINCSDGDLQRAEEIVAVAKTNGLLVTCGTDYHGLNKFVGGMCVPDWVKTGAEFNKYLRQTEETTVFLEDKVLRLPAFPPKKWLKKIF